MVYISNDGVPSEQEIPHIFLISDLRLGSDEMSHLVMGVYGWLIIIGVPTTGAQHMMTMVLLAYVD